MSLEKSSPPIFGEIQFELSIPPVSQQAKPSAKSEVTLAIRSITQSLHYILTGEISIEIEWLIHEKLRYESDKAPDVDNIIKPLLDGLCGLDGLLIDDCQVQAVTCYWTDWTREEQKINFKVSYLPDQWRKKKNLFFVQYPRGLCFPFNFSVDEDLPSEELNKALDQIEKMLNNRDQYQERGMDYYASKNYLPIQRFFHRSRINGFPVFMLDEIRDKVRNFF